MKKFSMPDDKTVGSVLKIYRKANRMTQQRVADYLGVSRSAYAKYETMRTPELEVIIKLSILYDTSLDDFLSPFISDQSSVAVAMSQESSGETLVVTKAEKMLLDFYRGCVRKAEVLKAAEDIYNSDIEIVNDIKE